MAFTCSQIYKPRQVIVVALLTSIFWFALNTVILMSYQGNIASNDQVARRLRVENKNYQRGFEQQLENVNKRSKLLPRGISEVEDFEEELDIMKGEIVQDKDTRNMNMKVMKNQLIDKNENNSLKKQEVVRKPRLEKTKKKPIVRKKKQISAVKTIPPEHPRKQTEGTNDAVHVLKFPDVKARDPNGPGEDGRAVVVAEGEKKNEKEGYSKYAFNEYVSEKISLVRSIPDTRSPG